MEIKLKQQKMKQQLKDNAIAVSLNKVPEIPSININGKKAAIKKLMLQSYETLVCSN